MGGEQKRAAEREAAKVERASRRVPRIPRRRSPSSGGTTDILGVEEKAARDAYRTAGSSAPPAKKARRVVQKPRKWREGRQ